MLRLRQRAPDHAVARRARRRARAAARASCRSARRGAGSARRTPTRRRGSASASRTCSTRRSCGEKVELALAEKNVWLERVYEIEPFDVERGRRPTLERYARAARAVRRRHRRCSSTALCATASACCSRARRARCSTSTTARIRSSPRRTRSPPAPRSASASARQRIDEVIGVAKAYVTRVGEGPFPSEIDGPDAGAGARARRRVRHRHRPRAPLRLARPRRAALRGARERDHVARADEARRALRRSTRSRSASATGCPTGARPTTSPPTSPTSTTAHRCSRRCPAGASELARTDALPGRRARLRRVRRGARSSVPVTLVGTGAARATPIRCARAVREPA